jgi:hypothetical protein
MKGEEMRAAVDLSLEYQLSKERIQHRPSSDINSRDHFPLLSPIACEISKK